jgi:hypothetical protein
MIQEIKMGIEMLKNGKTLWLMKYFLNPAKMEERI